MTTLQPKKPLFIPPPVGAALGAVQSSTEDEVRLYGYGTRIEDSIPPEAVKNPYADKLREEGVKDIAIQLESGEVVYAHECHWGVREAIERWINGRRVVHVQLRR